MSAGSRHRQGRLDGSGRWARWLDVPALTANIFAGVTNKTYFKKSEGPGQRAQKLTGENLQGVWTEFSTLS